MRVKIIYIWYHRNVKCSRHSAFMNACLLRSNVRANVFSPQIRCHQDAGFLLAISLGNEKVQIVPPSTKLAGIHLRFKQIIFKDNILERERLRILENNKFYLLIFYKNIIYVTHFSKLSFLSLKSLFSCLTCFNCAKVSI